MQFVTEEQAIRAAKKGVKRAIQSSCQKWYAFSHCTEEDFDEANFSAVDLCSSTCALCHLFINSEKVCPCAPEVKPCWGMCNGLWEDAKSAYYEWKYRKKPFTDFTKAALEVWKALKRLQEEYK